MDTLERKVIMSKDYSGESIIDAEQDLMDAINAAAYLPTTQGITDGTFHISVTWTPEEE